MRIKLLFLAALLLPGCGKWATPQPLFTAAGRVTNLQGSPLAGAVVGDGSVSVLSGEDGRYVVGVFSPTLSINKPGYQPTHRLGQTGEMPDVALAPATAVPRVALDSRSASGELTGFTSALKQLGLNLLSYPETPLSAIDALFIMTPGTLSKPEIQAIKNWVMAGGRLILCGEWGGFPAESLGTLNALSQPAGMTFTGATIKENGQKGALADWLTLGGLLLPSLSHLEGDQPLALFTTTALGLQAPAIPLLQSDSHAYAVQTLGAPLIIGAVGPMGRGKVFALGDSSLWRDTDSGATGKPNWQKQGNLELALAFLAW